MPTYEYRCTNCGHQFEDFQSITAPLKRKCPQCGKPKLERLIGIGAGFIFKGGGFYQTDYRSDSYKKAADAENKKNEKPAQPASAGESKPAAAESAKPEKPAEKKSAPARKRKAG